MNQIQALTILKTGTNVFLTGEPGAGKTHTINTFIAYLRKRGVEPAITASTGIAATHIGGMTIHSWSGIGIKSWLSKYDLDKISSSEYIAKRIKRARILIIEEVSMLSPETLDMVDAVCRDIRQNSDSFGGLQVIFVGDFFQLPPIQRNDYSAQATLIEKPKVNFAYDSSAWNRAKVVVCYLTEQHRQDDADFLNLLSAIRRNSFGDNHLSKIKKRKIEERLAPPEAPKLYSHNIDVDRVNNEMLSKIPKEPRTFSMSSKGPEGLVFGLKKGCLSPDTLTLKIGAAVMFTKNNPKEGYVNGTLGTVESFNELVRYPIVKTRDGRHITVEPQDWKFEEDGKLRAKISQLPLRLAWAITVHKSQGMSLDEAVMDLSQVFEYGQGYVALSRVRRLSGVHLLGWNERAFQVHPEILSKDGWFGESSTAAELAFEKIPLEEMAKMHNDFIRAVGGIMIDEASVVKKTKRRVKAEKAEKGAGFDEIRKKFPNAYKPWSDGDDKRLKSLFQKDTKIGDIAKIFGRKSGSIRSRLVKLGLVEYEQ